MNTNVDVLINIINKGGPEGLAVLEQVKKAAAEGSKDSLAVLEKLKQGEKSLAEEMARVNEESQKRVTLREQARVSAQQAAATEKSLADLMAEGREQAEKAAATRQKEMEANQAAAEYKARETKEVKAKSEAVREGNKLSEAYTNVLKDETEQTGKSTEAKRQQQQALSGLSRAFPEVAGTIKAMLNPIGLMTAALGAALTLVYRTEKAWDAWRLKNAEVRREMELMGDAQKTLGEIQVETVQNYERVAKGLAQVRTELDAVTEAQDRQMKSLLANREIEAELADEGLRAKMLALDADDKTPEFVKNRTRDALIKQAIKDKEAKAIAAVDEDAKRAAQQAVEARDLADRRASEASGMNPFIAGLGEGAATARTAADQHAAAIAGPLAELNKKIVALDAVISGSRGGSSMVSRDAGGTGQPMTPEGMRRRRDELAAEAKRMQDELGVAGRPGGLIGVAELAEDQHAKARARQEKIQAEAEAARARANALDKEAADKRSEAEDMRRRRNQVGPLRDANDARARRREYNISAEEYEERMLEEWYNYTQGGPKPDFVTPVKRPRTGYETNRIEPTKPRRPTDRPNGPESASVNTSPLGDVAASVDEANAAILAFAERVIASNKNLQQQIRDNLT
jgi:hypothetical protein